MQKLAVFILATALISCSSRQHEDQHRFEEFVHNLPSRQLPINFSCGLPNEFGTGNVESSELSEFAEFIPQNQNLIYGIINQTEEFTLIIYGETGDDIYPTLYSYNNVGKRIDSLF